MWGEQVLDPLAEQLDRLIERVDVRQQLRDEDPVVLDLEPVRERLLQLRVFARILRLARSANCTGSLTPSNSASSIARADFE